MKILALDPASVTGWALWDPDRPKPELGVRLFKKRPHDPDGQRFLEYGMFLEEVIYHFEPNVIYYEAPLFPGVRTARGNLTVSFGFEAILLAMGAKFGIECVPVHPATLKKWATGNGRADKAAMILAATRLTGVKLTNRQDNEADALCLMVYGLVHSGGETP